ncbi:hypothetical protein IWZ01DRAFT_347075 [Phyllosticta capitalensis]
MAAAAHLMPQPQSAVSHFSPYTDSPSSPAPFSPAFSNSTRSSGRQDSLHPLRSPYLVEPSPVDSNGTNTTDIDDDAQLDEAEHGMSETDDMEDKPSQLPQIDTSARPRSNSDDAPQSVIHAPSGSQQFETSPAEMQSPADTENSANTVVSPSSPASPDETTATMDDSGSNADAHPESVPAIDTSVPPKPDRPTPRAQTRQEADDELKRRPRSRASTNLEDISEDFESRRQSVDTAATSDAGTDVSDLGQSQTMDQALKHLNHAEEEIKALKTALSECWTLCNTLAGLSSSHRERMFNFSGQGEQGELAWKSCWRLCQKLYETREDHANEVKPTLELCREFCQALFDARSRSDEASDSVLRVSFELNNHLYNTADRNLPEAFRERTLDFYITLCHRLMKQRTSLPEETDSLLRACWSLAEMLFSLRQNKREGKPADEELLGSAVQACWELCDLFREGWTQIRPDRGTPRPSQSTFTAMTSTTYMQTPHPGRGQSVAPPSERSLDAATTSYHSAKSMPPETPTTIFDDTAEELSPDDEPQVPNILVLGPENNVTRTHDRWSSSASILSTYSDSVRTSSTARNSNPATSSAEDPHLLRLKTLILAAAMTTGYTRSLGLTLPQFVKTLPSTSFGPAPWQIALLASYKKLVLADPTLRVPGAQLPSLRLGAPEVARAVQWMARAEQFGWLRDLYRLVFGCAVEEGVVNGSGTAIQT